MSMQEATAHKPSEKVHPTLTVHRWVQCSLHLLLQELEEKPVIQVVVISSTRTTNTTLSYLLARPGCFEFKKPLGDGARGTGVMDDMGECSLQN